MLLLQLLFTVLSGCLGLERQDSSWVVNEIRIEGNKKTKAAIIERELDIAIGDTLQAATLAMVLERNRRKIFNTSLFNQVQIEPQFSEKRAVSLRIKVVEQWYVFVYPRIQLADRNYSEWWERGHSLDRLIWGVHINHGNMRGRAERLILRLEGGFAQKIELFYRIPYIDAQKRTGMGINLSYSTNKNVAYNTLHDTLAYIKSEQVLRKRFWAGISLRRRNKFYGSHALELRYNYNWIADTIRHSNAEYLGGGANTQRYFQLSYAWGFDFRDNVVYPLRGYRYEFVANKLGLGPFDDVNQFDISIGGTKYLPLGKKWFSSFMLKAKFSWPAQQPFILLRGLGYGADLVRGFELAVVDGQDYYLSRNNLRYKLLDKNIRIKFLKLPQFNVVPLQLYPNLIFDMGYVYKNFRFENKSSLANQLLYSYGVGIDLISYYNLFLRFHYVQNSLQQRTFAFNLSREF